MVMKSMLLPKLPDRAVEMANHPALSSGAVHCVSTCLPEWRNDALTDWRSGNLQMPNCRMMQNDRRGDGDATHYVLLRWQKGCSCRWTASFLSPSRYEQRASDRRSSRDETAMAAQLAIEAAGAAIEGRYSCEEFSLGDGIPDACQA